MRETRVGGARSAEAATPEAMTNLVLMALHVGAALYAQGLLIITIPTHLIYLLVYSGKVRCPDCAEWIRKEAQVCKHCGHRLAPEK